jgi:hypothetical protein
MFPVSLKAEAVPLYFKRLSLRAVRRFLLPVACGRRERFACIYASFRKKGHLDC